MTAIDIRTGDPDEAQLRCGEVYFPHRLAVLHDPGAFEMSLKAKRVGPISAGLLSYAGEVRLTTGFLETGYEINIPLTGRLTTYVSGHGEISADPTTAAVHRPDSAVALQGWEHGGSLLGIKIDRAAIETQLSALLDDRVHGVLAVNPTMDLRSGPGRQWWSLVRSIVELLRAPDGPLGHPMVSQPLAQSIVTGFLYAADHPYRSVLEKPSRPKPAAICRAVDILENEPEHPWTMVELAATCGLSLRALQGVSPSTLGSRPHATSATCASTVLTPSWSWRTPRAAPSPKWLPDGVSRTSDGSPRRTVRDSVSPRRRPFDRADEISCVIRPEPLRKAARV